MRKSNEFEGLDGIAVDVRDGRFEQALRQFNKKVQNSGIIREMRDRRYYEKPSTTRKVNKKIARKRHLKKLESEKMARELRNRY